MRRIYILSGLPGSGKTTCINQRYCDGDIILHRDDFRRALRDAHNTTDYFPVSAAEEFDLWTDHIKQSLIANPDAGHYIDQTTLGPPAVRKLLNGIGDALYTVPTLIHIIRLTADLETCWLRNKDRVGDERVPRSVLESMAKAPGFTSKDIDELAEEFGLPFSLTLMNEEVATWQIYS